MATNMRESRLVQPALANHHPAHTALRVTLVALAALVALTAIQGAIFVVPTMPTEVLSWGILPLFTDFTIPALALGVLCGGSALAALLAVVFRPALGGLLALVAGGLMVGFELVEIVAVGFTPAQTPNLPQAWLQVFYLVVGGLMAALGWRLWRVAD